MHIVHELCCRSLGDFVLRRVLSESSLPRLRIPHALPTLMIDQMSSTISNFKSLAKAIDVFVYL